MRNRICEIVSTNEDQLLEALERSINNTILTRNDYVDNGDEDATVFFYLDYYEGVLCDMRDDLKEILKAKKHAL